MKKMNRAISLILVLLMALSLCACGSSNAKRTAASSAPAYGGSYYADAAVEAPAEAPMEDYDYEEAGFAVNEAAYSAAGAKTEDAPEESPEKIIYSSDVNVETTEFEQTLARLDEMIAEYDGWVESSSVNGANFYNQSRGYVTNRSANYTLRIPSNRFDAMMNGLSALGNIPYTHTYTENVTAQYFDVQARLNAYKTQETRLLEMMEVAETVEDIILLEDRLTELRYEIESLQSTLNNWDRRVSYSTVYLNIQEVQEYTPEAENKLTFGQKLARAFTDGLRSVRDFFEDFLLWFLEALPSLAVLAVVVVLVVLLVKKIGARRKEKKQKKLAEQYAARQAALEAQRQNEEPKE